MSLIRPSQSVGETRIFQLPDMRVTSPVVIRLDTNSLDAEKIRRGPLSLPSGGRTKRRAGRARGNPDAMPEQSVDQLTNGAAHARKPTHEDTIT